MTQPFGRSPFSAALPVSLQHMLRADSDFFRYVERVMPQGKR